MKTINFKIAFFTAITFGIFTSCVNDDDYATPPFGCIETTLVKTKEVAQIPATTLVAQYTADDVIEAYVTSSDEAGNFYKSISFQTLNGSKGFSVPVDVTSTFTNFEPGRKVLIKMKDLYTDIRDGGLRIGAFYSDINSTPTTQVGRLNASQYATALNKSCTVVKEDDLVRTLTIPQALSDANLNTLIELNMVQFVDAALAYNYNDPVLAAATGGATNHLLTDAEGNTIVFRTSSFANFANNPVASGRGKVRGVLTKFGSTYQFLARSEDDIKLTGSRLVPLFSENFESIASPGNGTNIALPGWSNINMNPGAEKWEARTFSGNKYAQYSPFGLSPAENTVDTRLITKAINLDNSTGEFLRFGSKIGFANGVAVTAWISTNYTGLNTAAAINAATWTQLPATFAAQTTSFPTNFTSSGNIDLSSYSGNVYISFRYVGGTNNITSTYQIDNIEVYGN